MRRCLIGQHVRHQAPADQLRQHLGDVPHQPHRQRPVPRPRVFDQPERGVEIVLQSVAVARLDPAADARLVHVHAEEGRAVHRRRQRLGAPHPAETAGHHQAALERAAEMLPRALGEGLVRSLEDPLCADVDPRPRGHLPVHGEAESLEAAELVPGGPARHQVRVGDQHPRRFLVRPEDADRLAALHQQRLVVLQPPERGHDALVALPVPRRLAAAAVDDQLLGPLGDGRIEVVHQHPKRRLLVPTLAGKRGARRGGDRRVGEGGHGRQSTRQRKDGEEGEDGEGGEARRTTFSVLSVLSVFSVL